MLTPLQNAGLFLINSFFDFALLLLTVRLLLCWARADYFNPITRFIVNCSQFLVVPIRRILPTKWNIEFATLFIIIIFVILKYMLLGVIATGQLGNPQGLLVLTLGEFIKLICNVLFYSIFLAVIINLIQQGYSPLGRLLQQLTTPILRPFQRLIPPISGMDLSPIPVLIILQLIIILFAAPLLNLGTQATFG